MLMMRMLEDRKVEEKLATMIQLTQDKRKQRRRNAFRSGTNRKKKDVILLALATET
jgi:hypothetical protein